MEGEHIGAFQRDKWSVTDQSTYGPTPQSAINEPPRSWAHPPLRPKKKPPVLGQSESSSAFLTGVALDYEVEDEEEEVKPYAPYAMRPTSSFKQRIDAPSVCTRSVLRPISPTLL